MADDNRAKTDAEWKAVLPKDVYHIAREKGTERPGTSKFNKETRDGTYECYACGQILFHFAAPVEETAVGENIDRGHGMVRKEVVCTRCGAHLGHVFNDGPKERTGLRYCINGTILKFNPSK